MNFADISEWPVRMVSERAEPAGVARDRPGLRAAEDIRGLAGLHRRHRRAVRGALPGHRKETSLLIALLSLLLSS